MQEKRVFWSEDAPKDVEFNDTTWFRAIGIGDFVKRVLLDDKIVGVILRPSTDEESENIIGFILGKPE